MGRHQKIFMEADTTPKNQRLSIAQLATYDDLLTDVLVDKVYFWTNIRKNRTKYSQTRGISEEQVCNILFQDVVLGENVHRAEARLLELPGLKRFVGTLKTYKEREDFKKHMQKYISIWLPECPFEVSTTNRYTITSHEASTTARCAIARGETIKYLCGNLVAMTPEEEKEIELNRRDFSVVKQVRKKVCALFLGPARFANHDCKANARLCQQGHEGMTIVAMRDIASGEEITVDYGDHYFNHNNQDCLCATCETGERNGWAPETQNAEESKPTDESTNISRGSSLQPKSRKRSRTEGDDSAVDDDLDAGRPSKQARLHSERAKANTGLDTPPDSSEKSSPRSEHAVYALSQDTSDDDLGSSNRHHGNTSSYATTISPHSFHGSEQPCQAASASRLNAMPQRPSAEENDHELNYVNKWLNPGTTQSKPKARTSLWIPPNRICLLPNLRSGQSPLPGEDVDVNELLGQTAVISRTATPNSLSNHHNRRLSGSGLTPSSSTLSSVPPDFEEFGGQDMSRSSEQRPKKGRPLKPFHKLLPATRAAYMRRQHRGHPTRLAYEVSSSLRNVIATQKLADLDPMDDEMSDNSDIEPTKKKPRKPGDYIRTRSLLAVPNARWVDCFTCDTAWVQTGKETRRECPRCERHSKIYGFQWPKTKPKNANDHTRILDHRLINRLISQKEEKMLGRRGRGLQKPANSDRCRAASEDAEDETEIEEEDGARKLRRTQARALVSGAQDLQMTDTKAIEGKNERIKVGKGWVMVI